MRSSLRFLQNPTSQWLLKDSYNDAYAVGLVNGSADDVGNKRVVTDVNSKLSITGGILNFATGGVGANDPGVVYPGIPRIAGLILLATITPGNATSDVGLSLGTASNGTGRSGIRIFTDGTIRVLLGDISITLNTGFSYSSATQYQLAIVLRSTGMFFFVKGGAFTNWTLLHAYASGTTPTLYPNIAALSGVANVLTADNIRIPNGATYLPSPTAADAFSRANGALGSTDGLSIAENNGGIALVWTGSTWTIVSNATVNTPSLGSDVVTNGTYTVDVSWTKAAGWTIAGGVAVATAAANGNSITEVATTIGVWYQANLDVVTISGGQVSPYNGGATVVNPAATTTGAKLWTYRALSTALGLQARVSALTGTFDNYTIKPLTLSELLASLALGSPADVHIQADLTIVSGTQAGIVINLDSAATPANFVLAYHDGVNVKLDKCVAGTYTNLINAAATYSAGATLKVVKSGTKYAVIYNNVLIGTVQTISDAGIISNVIHGLFSTYSGNSLDNLIIRPTGTNNEYARLDFF